MLIQSLDKILIISPYGNRVREGNREFHPGIDVRVYNQDIDPNAQNILLVVAPENLECTLVSTGAWGDFAFFKPLDNPDVCAEIRMWHLTFAINKGDTIRPGDVIGEPQIKGKNTSKHLHFETLNVNRVTFNPTKYLDYILQPYGFKS